ncbi:hypothetical protein ABZ990_16520 [Streptomyces sp. NPDC046203]|uniref:LppU/SCO3897 family protein n=1 Tax=Streptomyces sp. NPDC046203 TaxID=3154602 RepID=UPI0033EF0183
MTTPPQSNPFADPQGAPVPPQAPMSAPEPAPQKKGSAVLKKVGGFVAILVVGTAVKLGIPYLTGDAPVHAEVGECITVTGAENDPKVETTDCSKGGADLYKVTQVHKGTFDLDKCGEELSAVAQKLGPDKFVLCMEPVEKG